MGVKRISYWAILSFCFLVFSWVVQAVVLPEGYAPRTGMHDARWSSSNKQGVGTSYEAYDQFNKFSDKSSTAPISKVWFTLAQGILTEVFWPTLDTPQTRDSQILVTDGSSFFFEERGNGVTKVEWLEEGVPAFKITNRDPEDRFTIERTIFTDPDSEVVLQKIRIYRNRKGLKFFYLHNPHVANTPMGNSAMASIRSAPGAGLFAWQDDQAQAIVFSLPLKQVSAGFGGTNDGWADLHQDKRMDHHFKYAVYGNVVLTAWLDIPETQGAIDFVVAMGFGKSKEVAYEKAQHSLRRNISATLEKYTSQWKQYQASIRDLSKLSQDDGKLFRASVATLKATEDKTFEGAFVASPSIPWGLHQVDKNADLLDRASRVNLTGGYHLVWPRDLYQMATTFMAIDDPKSAIASLNFLRRVQHTDADGEWDYGKRRRSKDGTFPQNCWVDGEPYWVNLQMDEIAYPIILAYRLWKGGHIEWNAYWDMVKRAADFIEAIGPWTPQERWEETFGISPTTIASEIAALWGAREFAEAAQDWDRANRYREKAYKWATEPGNNLDNWTFTTTGDLGNGKYYVRIEATNKWDQIWNPNDNIMFQLANGGGKVKEKNITDGGFLELVRLGVRNALDYHVVESIPEIDQTIRVDMHGIGAGFFRYLGDRYNYRDLTGEQTLGMLWPLLTGERGHYELAKAVELKQSEAEIHKTVEPYLLAMEKMATRSYMLPEQVWDGRSGPAGLPTGAATPLGWAHGEYIKLLRSLQENRVFDTVK